MVIRKLFKFEGAHIVRNCTSRRCSHSLHGHSYKVEVFLQATALDRGQMIYDFGLLKETAGVLIDAFDHTLVFWDGDDPEYIATCQRFSERWISLPVSPSAEQLSRVFFRLIDALLDQAQMLNGEQDVTLSSIIVHETDSGYAQCFRADAENIEMGQISLAAIQFASAIKESKEFSVILEQLLAGKQRVG